MFCSWQSKGTLLEGQEHVSIKGFSNISHRETRVQKQHSIWWFYHLFKRSLGRNSMTSVICSNLNLRSSKSLCLQDTSVIQLFCFNQSIFIHTASDTVTMVSRSFIETRFLTPNEHVVFPSLARGSAHCPTRALLTPLAWVNWLFGHSPFSKFTTWNIPFLIGSIKPGRAGAMAGGECSEMLRLGVWPLTLQLANKCMNSCWRLSLLKNSFYIF